MTNLKKLASSQPGLRLNILRRVGQIASFLVVTALLLFIAAGSLTWLYAWLYMGVSLLIILINSFFATPELAELVAERGRKKENVEKWDPLLSGLILLPWLGIYLVAGLDFRWQWFPELVVGWHLGALIMYVLGNYLALWAMTANRFFSTAVRIQFDRGQTVCSGGPYRYIRHPGYLGMIIYILASPIILGSLWAMIPAIITMILFMVRTWLEDITLRQKLPGYREYANRVRYRLIPGLW